GNHHFRVPFRLIFSPPRRLLYSCLVILSIVLNNETEQRNGTMEQRMNITILGSGFAALTAVKEVRKQAPQAEITVVSPQAELIYLPSLIWLPSGLRKGSDLRIPLPNFFRRQRVQHHAATVQGMSADGRTVHTDAGDIANDGLIITSGGRFLKKLPGIEHVITPCEGIKAGEAIRDRLAAMPGGTIAIGFAGNPNEPAAMRGGPMFEFLFGIDTLLR